MSSTHANSNDSSDSWHCPINLALEMFGDRWSLLLIRDMMFLGKRRYGEFLDSNEAISTNILAARLKRLQQLNFIERFPDPDNARTAIYLLTDRGLSLYPLMLEVIRWGMAIDPKAKIIDEVADAVEHGGESLWAVIRAANHAQREQLACP